MDKLGASKISSDMSTLANSNAIFAPCETLLEMADKGDKFYTTAAKTAEVELEQADDKSTDTQNEKTEHKD